MERPTILIADDHEKMLWHIKIMLDTDFDVVAAVSNGRAAVEATTLLHPDVVLFDISMPILNGLDAAARLAELGSPSRVVFLSMHDDEGFIHAAQVVGARAYVLKRQMGTHLIHAIRHALTDSTAFLSPESREDRSRALG